MIVTYESDFYGWAMEQANLLKSGRVGEADIANLVEEIESMGRSEKRALESALGRLLQHLLKWHYQPVLRSRSWELTIKNQRRELKKTLRDNPSLNSKLDDILVDAYETAKGWTEAETGLPESSFPESCPWLFEDVVRTDFLPG